MTEYITKEQAIDEVWDAFTSRDDPDLGRVIEAAIKAIPVADVAPEVYARWVYEDVDLICSNCGMDALTEGGYRQVRSDYCPHCGARMGGGESGD